MSFCVPFDDLSADEITFIRKKFTLKKICEPHPESRRYFIRNKTTNNVYLPLGYWKDFYEEFPTEKGAPIDVEFKGKLYNRTTDPRGIRDQDVVVHQAKKQLKENHCCFLALHTGFGKTIIMIYLFVWAKMKTVIITYLDQLQKQWKERVEEFSTAKVQIVDSDFDPSADVYIIGVLKVSSMKRGSFPNIGTVIYDEAHQATEAACKFFLKIEPYYLIGATATPYRTDNLHKTFGLFFGESKIFREEKGKSFRVVKYETSYKPVIGYRQVYGRMRLKWQEMQSSLASNPNRQAEIVQIVLNHPSEKILILSDRKDQSEAIFEMLREKEEDVELLIGRSKKWNRHCRILVAGMKKAGVGFDDPNLTMLILATDVKRVQQYEGRLRTDNCLIYDVVDNYSTLETHWKGRRKWYLRKGATIEIRKRPSSRQTPQLAKPTRFLSPNDIVQE